MLDDFDKDALAEAESRWPTYFSGMLGEREKERYDTFLAGARWAKQRFEASKGSEPLLQRAEALKELTGLSLHQIASAVGLTSRQELYTSVTEAHHLKRFEELEKLVAGLSGTTTKERGAELFSSEHKPTLYSAFKAASPTSS